MGSKIKINSVTGRPLNLFEVQVISGGFNIAQDKVATQSSTLFNHTASLALDNNVETFSHTNDINPYFEVDLIDAIPDYLLNPVEVAVAEPYLHESQSILESL